MTLYQFIYTNHYTNFKSITIWSINISAPVVTALVDCTLYPCRFSYRHLVTAAQEYPTNHSRYFGENQLQPPLDFVAVAKE